MRAAPSTGRLRLQVARSWRWRGRSGPAGAGAGAQAREEARRSTGGSVRAQYWRQLGVDQHGDSKAPCVEDLVVAGARRGGVVWREHLRHKRYAGQGRTRHGRARMELRRGSSGRTRPGGNKAARSDGLAWAGLGPRGGGGADVARRRTGGRLGLVSVGACACKAANHAHAGWGLVV
jgi:hypothetical protein